MATFNQLEEHIEAAMNNDQPKMEQKRLLNERVTTRWAMHTLKGEVVVVMDPKLLRSPASNLAVERVLKLASQCLAPMKQSRPPMKKCAEVLWGIRKELKEMGVCLFLCSFSNGFTMFSCLFCSGLRRGSQDLKWCCRSEGPPLSPKEHTQLSCSSEIYKKLETFMELIA